MFSNSDFFIDKAGEYTKEILINDIPENNRQLVTNVNVLDEISRISNSQITCKGRFYTKSQLLGIQDFNERPLYLSVRSTDQDSVKIATDLINKLINQKEKFLIDKVILPFRDIYPQFGIHIKLTGVNNQNFKYINKVTGGTKLSLKGQGTQQYPFFVSMVASCKLMMMKGKKLLDSLVDKVTKDYEVYLVERKKREKEMKEKMKNSLKKQSAINPFTNPMMFQMGGFKQTIYTNIDKEYDPNLFDYNPDTFNKYKSNIDVLEDDLKENMGDNYFGKGKKEEKKQKNVLIKQEYPNLKMEEGMSQYLKENNEEKRRQDLQDLFS